jgi:hypothetical protein
MLAMRSAAAFSAAGTSFAAAGSRRGRRSSAPAGPPTATNTRKSEPRTVSTVEKEEADNQAGLSPPRKQVVYLLAGAGVALGVAGVSVFVLFTAPFFSTFFADFFDSSATMVVMYTLRREGDFLLGPLHRRVYASFAPKRHAFEIARREADKRGFGLGSGRHHQVASGGR